MENSILGKMALTKSEAGYTPADFTEGYWLDSASTEGLPRAHKDYSKIVLYFQDLFAVAGTKNDKILDIGAGAGAGVKALQEAGFKAQGCEFSPSGRDVAMKLFDISLSPCDLRERLPYRTNNFGWGLCSGVLSMIPREFMANALKEIFRVVRYGVLINVGTVITAYDPENVGINPHHITAMSPGEYYELLQSLDIRDWTSIQPPQKLPYGIGVLSEFAGLFSRRAWGAE